MVMRMRLVLMMVRMTVGMLVIMCLHDEDDEEQSPSTHPRPHTLPPGTRRNSNVIAAKTGSTN